MTAMRRWSRSGCCVARSGNLKNRWEFHADPKGTRLEFTIDFAFKSPLLNAALQANFDRAVSMLIGSFEAEAARRFGPKP